MLGIVRLSWAFAENGETPIPVVCYVLPYCIYDLILGNEFLTATQTLSKYRHRLTRCRFSTFNSFARFAYLGGNSQRLRGKLADEYDVLAIPDTGAERNVMSLEYALAHGLTISNNREYVQFADGTCQETEGCVDSHWTFESGERIPITFAVLRGCCSDVILGDHILEEHRIFGDHASSLTFLPCETDFFELAPFDFIRTWQRPFGELGQRLKAKQRKPEIKCSERGPANDYRSRSIAQFEEQRLVDQWNYKYDFGANANAGERELERLRRNRYASDQAALADPQQGVTPTQIHGTGAVPSGRRLPIIPTIPTAQVRR